MNELGLGQELAAARPLSSGDAAKARFLAWAERIDAEKLKARPRMGSIVTGGALAIFGGLVLARVLLPGPKRGAVSSVGSMGAKLVSWALLARAGKWLLPYAIRAVQSGMKPRALGQ